MKKIASVLMAIVIFATTTVYASVLGEISGGYTNNMGLGSFFYKTEFSGGKRGNQAEHYIKYTPNSDITPVMVSGEQLWGALDMYQANNIISNNGFRSKGAINADFFSFQTGLSMGYSISDGIIETKVYEKMPAIGFRADGTAFIDDLQIKTTIFKDDNSAEILFINKWCQEGFDPIYLLTDYFGKTTKTNFNCLYVIGEIEKGSISLNEDAIFSVEEVFEYDREIDIPKDKAILLIDADDGNAELMEFMRLVEIGDKLTIKNEYINSEKKLWSEAKEACSTITPQLLKNSVIGESFEAGVNPRTAAGITDKGEVIFYTLDGRKTGYSIGASLDELAIRMKELGCVDAINFDGGGSTAIGAKLSDLPSFQILNRPSDGSVRKVANYIFLRDNRMPTGIPKEIKYNNLIKNVFIGSNQDIEIESVLDSAEYIITDYNAKISSDDAKVSGKNISFDKSGVAVVNVEIDDYFDEITFNVYDRIDAFNVYDAKTWNQVESIRLNTNDSFTTQLRVVPYADENELLLNDGVVWEIIGDVGEISQTGNLTISSNSPKRGKIKVTLANITKEIDVDISDNLFFDLTGHWSEDMVSFLHKENIINGVNTHDGLLFFPDEKMSRAEFAAIISRYLNLDTENYKDIQLPFADSGKIQPWAQNIIKTVFAEGVMNGKSSDGEKALLFEPDADISRAEAMTVIGRTISQKADYSNKFADDDDIPDWAREEIYKLLANGIIIGYNDNTILPGNSVTRAEAASMIYKLISGT